MSEELVQQAIQFIIVLLLAIPAEIVVGQIIKALKLEGGRYRLFIALFFLVLAFGVFLFQNDPELIDNVIHGGTPGPGTPETGDNSVVAAAAPVEVEPRVITATPPPVTDTPGPEPTRTTACRNNDLPPRLEIGMTGWVIPEPPQANLLRSQPGADNTAFERIEPGRTFVVLDGPVCADNINWWQVRSYEGVVGWTSEGANGTYFLDEYPG